MSHKFLNINWDLFDKKSAESREKLRQMTLKNDNTNTNANINTNTIIYERPLTYFLPPPTLINSTLTYQDVNKDPRLREDITNFFLQKTIKWITSYSEFKNKKHLLPKLKTQLGYELIYNILRQFIKKNECNWYDLRNNYELVKDFIRFKIT